MDLSSIKGKKVLLTGHTGFKGSWMCMLLNHLGAEVSGYALDPPTDPSLYGIANLDDLVTSEIGDIRDLDRLSSFYTKIKPDYVIHMAAQPLVREGYVDPRHTYESNVMGTVNILECVRLHGCRSFLNVTTDKVYRNLETGRRYVESDELDGYDPYSNSKSCSELVTATYRRSFPSCCPISTARAGNVIGGGDFAKDRIVPDCIRAASRGGCIVLRNPNSVRPYQHVLEPLNAYLTILVAQDCNPDYADSYNIGPREEDVVTTGRLADIFCGEWGDATWKHVGDDGPHEANLLMLDGGRIEKRLGFTPKWCVRDAIAKTVEFTKDWLNGKDVRETMTRQIREYLGE